jgi:outer membrane protein OmpA-like peptidoglycan-associated protein
MLAVFSLGLLQACSSQKQIVSRAFEGLEFATDSDRILPSSYPVLDDLATHLNAHPELKLSIEGHTDNTGTHEHNQQLSERRAASVKKYLAEKGVATDRITTAGFSSDRPVASNDTPEGRQKNRRVEFILSNGD